MMKLPSNEINLIESYVDTFGLFEDLCEFQVPAKLITHSGGHGMLYWRPAKVETRQAHLDAVYSELPVRFSPLFESLILSYRWISVSLGRYRLLPNEPANDLTPLREAIVGSGMYSVLTAAGYLQFGQGEYSFDPVCFDFRNGRAAAEYRIVQIDHEEILCNDRIKVVQELAPNFQALVLDTISRAETKR